MISARHSHSRGRLARAWELRSAMDLARMLSPRGDVVEARSMLARLYSSFTEGLDTADLKDANALLEELSNLP